ncbi:MAG: Gfo/Idh/MocA family protein [Candidatus Onthomonas sp.]
MPVGVRSDRERGISLKIGIAGAGSIVPTFLSAQAKIPGLVPCAICASPRSRERMERLSQQYGISKIYYSYEDMLCDPSIEAVYIAVPNHLHYQFARMALERGLSVLCEKPFCSNARQLEALIWLAEQRRLFLFEAVSNLYFPNYEKVRELLPELGALRIVEMNYSQYSSRYNAFRRGEVLPVFDPRKSGGALMDLNVYNLHFTVGLFGKPAAVQYFPNLQRGIDTSGVLVLQYPGFICTLTAAKDCKAPCRISIQGERGCIYSDCPSNSFERFTLSQNTGEAVVYALNAEKERLFYELLTFSELVSAADFETCREQLRHSLDVQRIVDEARMQAGIPILE